MTPTRRRGVKFTRVYLQAPEPTVRTFKEMVDADYGHRGIKLLGTAMISVMVGLPREIRDAMFDWASNAEFRPDLANNTQNAVDGFIEIINDLKRRIAVDSKDGDAPISKEAQHFIDRLCDPALLNSNPPPLRKTG
jgi:hypothetical protein